MTDKYHGLPPRADCLTSMLFEEWGTFERLEELRRYRQRQQRLAKHKTCRRFDRRSRG